VLSGLTIDQVKAWDLLIQLGRSRVEKSDQLAGAREVPSVPFTRRYEPSQRNNVLEFKMKW